MNSARKSTVLKIGKSSSSALAMFIRFQSSENILGNTLDPSWLEWPADPSQSPIIPNILWIHQFVHRVGEDPLKVTHAAKGRPALAARV